MDDRTAERACARGRSFTQSCDLRGAPEEAAAPAADARRPHVAAFHDRGLAQLMYREYAVRALRVRHAKRETYRAASRIPEAMPHAAANANAGPSAAAPNPVLLELGLMTEAP